MKLRDLLGLGKQQNTLTGETNMTHTVETLTDIGNNVPVVSFDADDTLYDYYNGKTGKNDEVLKCVQYAIDKGFRVIILSVNPSGAVLPRLTSAGIYLPDSIKIFECNSKNEIVETLKIWNPDLDFLVHVGDSTFIDLCLHKVGVPVLLYNNSCGPDICRVNNSNILKVFKKVLSSKKFRNEILDNNVTVAKPKKTIYSGYTRSAMSGKDFSAEDLTYIPYNFKGKNTKPVSNFVTYAILGIDGLIHIGGSKPQQLKSQVRGKVNDSLKRVCIKFDLPDDPYYRTKSLLNSGKGIEALDVLLQNLNLVEQREGIEMIAGRKRYMKSILKASKKRNKVILEKIEPDNENRHTLSLCEQRVLQEMIIRLPESFICPDDLKTFKKFSETEVGYAVVELIQKRLVNLEGPVDGHSYCEPTTEGMLYYVDNHKGGEK